MGREEDEGIGSAYERNAVTAYGELKISWYFRACAAGALPVVVSDQE